MSRLRWFILVPFAAAAVALGARGGPAEPPPPGTPGMAVAGVPVLSPTADGPADGPFPVARVRVSEDQLTAALKAFDPGTLVRMPRREFEQKARKAGAAVAEAARAGPRVAEAKYTASLSGSSLVGGAEWVVLNPRPRAAFLPLDPLRIAVRSPAWADGTEAVVGAFGDGFPAGPGVWVPAAGRQVLRMTWSAAGTGTTADRQFELRVPPCPASVLDLDLPADRVPVVATADVLVTGPLPVSGDAKRRSWQVRFGDRSRVELGVRGAGDAGGGGAVRASVVTRYDLTPGQAACEFRYDLRPAKGSVAEWAFTLPPGFLVTDAAPNNRAGWRVDPATRELRVPLRQPGAGGTVLVKGVAPLPPAGKPVPLPVVRPVGGLVGDDRVEIRVAPELDLAGWEPGDYRLTDSSAAADAGRVLTLVGTLLPPGATEPHRRPPSVQVTGSEPLFGTEEGIEWRVEAGRVYLSARVGITVRRGPLFQVAFRAPPGFTLDRTTGTPANLVAFAGPVGGPAGGIVVEFARPVATGQDVALRLDFRGQLLAPGHPATLPFPPFGPQGAATRDGWVSIDPGPGWSVVPRPAPGVAAPADPDALDSPPPATADAVFAYRGKEPDGELILTPVRPTFSAATDTRVDLAGGRLTAATRVGVTVSAGVLPALTVYEPGPATPGRTWRVADGSNAVTGVTPVAAGELPAFLPLLARPGAGFAPTLSTAAATQSGPGTYWVVRLARPVDDAVALETTATLAADATPDAAREWAAGRREWLAVRGAAAQTTRVEVAPALGGVAGGSRVDSAASPGWTFADLSLVTICSEPDALAVFGGTVSGRGGVSLPVRLPAGADVRSASVGGHRLGPGQCVTTAGENGPELLLPIPAGTDPVRFEVRYQLGREGGRFARRVASPVPELPGEAGPVARRWAFPRDTMAAWPFAVRDDSPPDLPPLLGEPLGDLVVSGYPGETVLTVPARLADAAGVGLAGLVAALGWVGAWRGSRSIGFALLAALIGAGVAFLLGPAAWERAGRPVLAVGLPALAAVVVARGRTVPRPPPPAVAAAGRSSTMVRAAVVAGLLIAGAITVVAARAEPAAGDLVFILPGPADAPTREVVLAPRTLLDKLDAATRVPEPTTIVTAATYEGRAEDGLARFTARFVVQSFRDGETAVVLPLADVMLERVTVGGKAAAPVSPRPDLYTVAVPGRGRHEVEARFAVPVTATGPEREVKFGVPEVADSRLAFAAPGTARLVQAVGRFGDQKTATDKDAARLDADLGGVRVVQLRWRQGATTGAATMTAREGCVWDVSEAGAALTACYQIRVDAGVASLFRFDVPADLEPVRVAVRSLEAAAAPVTVRDWSIGATKGATRPLRIDLAAPADGRLLVTLECVPRDAPTRRSPLRFPKPVGMDHRGGVYGLRATGVTVEGVARTGVIDFAEDAMVREFGSIPALGLNPAVPVQAFSLRPGETAELRPTLRPGPAVPTATQEATWRFDPRRADGSGVIRWTAEEPLPLLEFTLPAVRLLEVRGAEVAGWAQTDGRVQVWFRRPAKGGAVEWVATLGPTVAGKPLPEPLVFEPPVPGLPNVRLTESVVRVHPADGWAVRVERDRGWARDGDAADRDWAFKAIGPTTPLRLALFPPRGRPAGGFGLVEVGGGAVSYRAVVALPLAGGRPHHLVLRVAGLPAGATTTPDDLPAGATVHERAADADEREWDIAVPPSPAGVFRAVVNARLPAGRAVPLPSVWCGVGGTVPDPVGVVRWVGLSGPGTRLDGAAPVSPAERTAAQQSWPGEADRLRRTGGTLWTVPGGPPTVITDPPANAAAAATPSATTTPPAAPVTPGSPRLRPVLFAAGWCLVILAAGGLFALMPRATWPEQVGLIGGLFGFAVGGGLIAAAVVYGLARVRWLADRISRRTGPAA